MADSSSNPWFGVSMALVGVIVGYGIAMGTNAGIPTSDGNAPTAAAVPTPTPSPTPAARPTPSAKDVVKVDPKEDHIMGDPDALISIIEYSDYECPFCVRHHPTVAKLVEANDDVNWVYRHFPLSFHPNAAIAAEGSECVTELGGNDAFWEFTDLVMESGPKKENLAGYAEQVGVDVAKFNDCLDSGKYAQKVKDQMAGGSAGGVTGTPGNIVINNKTGETRLISGAQPAENFQAAIEALREG